MPLVRPYQIKPDKEVVVFINGFKARSILGFIWLWLKLPQMIWKTKEADGCFECLPALVSPMQVIMISYWTHQDQLKHYVKSKMHQKYMSFVYKYPKALALFNESYHPHKSGLYHNGPIGLAKQELNK